MPAKKESEKCWEKRWSLKKSGGGELGRDPHEKTLRKRKKGGSHRYGKDGKRGGVKQKEGGGGGGKGLRLQGG